MSTIYQANAYRDENGVWCATVEELNANTDAASFLELRANLTEAVHVSIDPPVPPFSIEVYVRVQDMGAAIGELIEAEELTAIIELATEALEEGHHTIHTIHRIRRFLGQVRDLQRES